MSGGKKAKPQKVETGPPAWMRPYLQNAFSEAGNLYNNSGPFIGFNPQQEQAMGLISDRALQGTPGVFGDVNNQLSSTLQGDYLHGGSGFNAAYQAAANKIIPQVNSAFGAAGRSGSGLAATAQTQALGDAFAGLYGQERGRQLQAASLAPGVAQAQQGLDYQNLAALQGVGDARRGMDIEQRDYPWANLQRYAGLLGGLSGAGGQTQTTQMYKNPLVGALGGGLLGFQLGGPWGAAGGAVLGGLLS